MWMLSRLNGLALLVGVGALTSICAVAAHAADDPAAAVAVAGTPAGNPVDGEKKFYTCVGCHGIDDYKNAYPDYSVPRLRHQNSGYIISALQ
jgi:cytochrome c553